jgi:hypothetical protein
VVARRCALLIRYGRHAVQMDLRAAPRAAHVCEPRPFSAVQPDRVYAERIRGRRRWVCGRGARIMRHANDPLPSAALPPIGLCLRCWTRMREHILSPPPRLGDADATPPLSPAASTLAGAAGIRVCADELCHQATALPVSCRASLTAPPRVLSEITGDCDAPDAHLSGCGAVWHSLHVDYHGHGNGYLYAGTPSAGAPPLSPSHQTSQQALHVGPRGTPVEQALHVGPRGTPVEQALHVGPRPQQLNRDRCVTSHPLAGANPWHSAGMMLQTGSVNWAEANHLILIFPQVRLRCRRATASLASLHANTRARGRRAIPLWR